MSKILGVILIFAAAWLMVRLQAGSGSCCGGGYDRHGSDLDHEQVCCGDMSTGLGHARNEEGGRRKGE